MQRSLKLLALVACVLGGCAAVSTPAIAPLAGVYAVEGADLDGFLTLTLNADSSYQIDHEFVAETLFVERQHEAGTWKFADGLVTLAPTLRMEGDTAARLHQLAAHGDQKGGYVLSAETPNSGAKKWTLTKDAGK
jgi:hypothetical protein